MIVTYDIAALALVICTARSLAENQLKAATRLRPVKPASAKPKAKTAERKASSHAVIRIVSPEPLASPASIPVPAPPPTSARPPAPVFAPSPIPEPEFESIFVPQPTPSIHNPICDLADHGSLDDLIQVLRSASIPLLELALLALPPRPRALATVALASRQPTPQLTVETNTALTTVRDAERTLTTTSARAGAALGWLQGLLDAGGAGWTTGLREAAEVAEKDASVLLQAFAASAQALLHQ